MIYFFCDCGTHFNVSERMKFPIHCSCGAVAEDAESELIGEGKASRKPRTERKAVTRPITNHCIHLREELRQDWCGPCQGFLKVFRCDGGHKECTIQKKIPGVDCCKGCRELVRPEGSTVAPERDWNLRPEVIEQHRALFAEVLSRDYAMPASVGSGRGIVTLGGGLKYFICCYVLIRLLRTLGSETPIEWVYIDSSEVTPAMLDIMGRIPGVDAVDLSTRCNPRITGGWNAKVWSIVTSRFREVLFLDADQLPIRDPTYLFDDDSYLDEGSVLWADIPNIHGLDITADAFRVMGLPVPGNEIMPTHRKPSDYRPVESGQILVDKSRCWRALQVCCEINDHSDFFYPMPRGKFHWHCYGDKSTFFLAWEATGTVYVKPPVPLYFGKPANGGFLQCDPTGEPIFQHRCTPQTKYELDRPQVHASGCQHLDLVDMFLDELRGKL